MPRNRTIGGLIDSLICLKSDGKGLRDYIKTIAEHSGLSSRQIDRIRKDDNLPPVETMKNLIKAVPELEVLNPDSLCSRLLLPFNIVQRDQEQLIKKLSQDETKKHFPLKITIVAGWKPPQGLERNDIALSIAENIRCGFEYEFIFPACNNYPHDKNEEEVAVLLNYWRKLLIKKTRDVWRYEESKKKTKDLFDLSKIESNSEEEEIDIKLEKSIQFISTQNQKTTQFWLLMPSLYVVLYNLDWEGYSYYNFGSYWTSGSLFNQYGKDDQEPSQGWLYVSNDNYKSIQIEYKKHRENWKKIE